MTYEEKRSYVAHNLSICGRTDTLFSDDALGLIHQSARGLPRSVNNYCRQSLIATYAVDGTIVDEKSVKKAIVEQESE